MHQLKLPVTLQGKLDALVMWFDLHLDSEISLSSAPEANSCWEQAVFPVLPYHLKQTGMKHCHHLSHERLPMW